MMTFCVNLYALLSQLFRFLVLQELIITVPFGSCSIYSEAQP